MGAAQTDKESAPVKWGLIAMSILGAVLLIAAILSMSRALTNSSPHGSVNTTTNEVATMDTVLPPEAIERQDRAEQQTVPVVQVPPAVPPAVTPTKQHNDEVKLQKARAKYKQLIVERMKQYNKDNPSRDSRELEK